MADFSAVDAISDQAERADAFQAVVADCVGKNDVDRLTALFQHLLSEGEGATRRVLESMPQALAALAPAPLRAFCEAALEALEPRRSSYIKLDVHLRELLSEVLQNEGEFEAAARVLSVAATSANAGSASFSDQEKTELCVKVAELFLVEEMSAQAETYVNRASTFVFNATEPMTILRHKVCKARVLDAKREFYKAACIFYQLSQTQNDDIDHDSIAEMLSNACTCVILAGAGERGRHRLMGSIYRDPRAVELDHFEVLENMYRERLLRWEEGGALVRFEAALAEHQKADVGGGLTVLQRAVNEHNMLAASRVYSNVAFAELGTLLGVDAASAEDTASKMIKEGRLEATIDQVAGVLAFAAGAEALSAWDEHIKHLCLEVNAVAEAAAKKYPAVAPA
uniref:COP9 signalosome complex subunit 4 n=1 Tax=Bicosoecida sp. CB-2014 TaxID=1486930 RepID=A0A7S1C7T8_9STRA